MLVESKYNVYILSKGEYYVYNLLFRTLVLVKDYVYETIKNRQFEEISRKTLNTLMKYGMILDEKENEYEIMLNHVFKSSMQMKEYSAFLSLTSMCNLNCDYCYQDYRVNQDFNKGYMSYEKVDLYCKYIENLIERHNLKSINIVFFGGEPLVCKEKFLYAVKKISNIDIEKKYSIVTNGTLIDDEIIDLFEKHKMSVQITFDGDKELHDQKRIRICSKNDSQCRGTFDVIWENVKKLLERIPNQTIIRMNIHQNNSAPYIRLLEEISRLQSKPSTVSLGSLIDGQVPEAQHHIHDHECVSEIRAYGKAKGIPIDNSFIIGPCMYHGSFASAVDENLNVYPCPGFLYGKKGGYINEYGYHVKNDFWYSTLRKVPECVKECKYAPICYGGCKMNRKCNKDFFDRSLEGLIEAHISSTFSNISLNHVIQDMK